MMLSPSSTARTVLSCEQFQQQIEREFCQGSGIDTELFAATVQIRSDLEFDAVGEPITPIHDALDWRYTRFGFQVKQTLYGALLLNEDGSLWQAKLSQPRKDDRGKTIKYETRKGNGSRAFLPHIPTSIRRRIADRYGIDVPTTGSFWQWLEQHPEIEILFTEGGKKALSLLSLGYVAIALYGVNGGYCKNSIGERLLIEDVGRFTVPGRSIVLAFDQDAEVKTRLRVNVALSRFGGLLQQAGCAVTIATWDGRLGKGVDDLIVASGAGAWGTALDQAMPLAHWRIWQKLESRLTWKANLRINTADLSTLELDQIPQEGIIGVSSGKGTGKTKWTAQQVLDLPAVLSAGHRIALQRNLSKRLGLDYIGDCDKAKGQFINGSAYTLRIGFCVDSLLAIDPEQFRGCDLVLDEVVQVVRHLLTSSTCAKDGKRPALLARFRSLIQMARRVIVADADLDNATLHYIRELRGEDAQVFLIRNDYQSNGYPCTFIESSDRSAVVGQLLDEIGSLPPGHALFVCLDSKALARTIERLIEQSNNGITVWNINSESSGGEFERSVISSPDPHLLEAAQAKNRLVILATPSMGTGVSIECQGIVQRVYGIFTGVSINDADMSQALSRVRERVERIVWCAQTGSSFNKVSRSTNAMELKRHLQERTAVTVSLIRSSLREDIAGELDNYDWQSDPHVDLYSKIAAEQNWSMLQLADALQVRLRYEGNRLTVARWERDESVRSMLAETRSELKEMDAEAIVAARILTLAEKLELESKDSVSPEDKLAIERFNLCDFYVIDPHTLTVDFVLLDKQGRLRGEIANLEAQFSPEASTDRTVKALEKQASWNQGLCPWDIANSAVRQAIRKELGLDDFLNPDKEWTKYDLQTYAEKALQFAPAVKAHLHFTVSEKMSEVQIVHQLLSQLGIKVDFCWSRSVEGYEGEKLRVYRVESSHWHLLKGILDRREQRRKAAQSNGSPPTIDSQKQTGDPKVEVTETELQSPTAGSIPQDSIEDLQAMWADATTDEEREAVRAVFEALIAG
ncbi:plasmid replication protein, CyRepA1 family [Leptolyngbya ohadii]|uniref:plasmid replication protein, CyRepA1 family n=1 Tax=Leptolyngbya ohadii TaxID=1962290 RepID=UPI000B59A17F|nr:plasmid replication protein, CyRepA1 family [Leptolyngbya ohadii]